MPHKEWRSFGIAQPVFIDGPDSSITFYNALGVNWVLLRMLVSISITARVIETVSQTQQPVPIICQVDNFDGAEGDPPPSLRGDPHSLLVCMPTLYPSTAVGLGTDPLLPVVTRLWVGGTGGQPISVAGRRDSDGSIGGRHVNFISGRANNDPLADGIGFTTWSIVWDAKMLVEIP